MFEGALKHAILHVYTPQKPYPTQDGLRFICPSKIDLSMVQI